MQDAEESSDDEWQQLIEATDVKLRSSAGVLSMVRGKSFTLNVRTRLASSAAQVLDAVLEGASRLRPVLNVIGNVLTMKWYVFHFLTLISFVLFFRAHTHTPVQQPFARDTRVSRYQKGKTNLDSTEARDSEWQWHPLGHMQVCTDNHASNQLLCFTGRMLFLPPNQQHQSTEGIIYPLANTDNKNTVRTSDCRTTRQNKCTHSRSSQAGTK